MTALLPGGRALPRLHVTHSPRHGVTQYAQRLADALVPSRAGDTDARPHDRTHVHFTDRLWGSDPAGAASAFELFAERGPVTVTLHDVPQASDGARNLERRSACYRRVVAAASGVVCNSRHEAALIARHVDPRVQVAVIPLPVDRLPAGPLPAGPLRADRQPADAAAHTAARPAVSVLGFVYPGKGHERVISAVAHLDPRRRPVVEVLGRASEGHERDLEVLAHKAAVRGVELTVTGYLPDDELIERSRASAVPVIAHEHVSASGSLTNWLGAGRRPLVLQSPYMEEMAQLNPGALTLVDPRWLPAALERALAHPETTWLDAAVPLGPTTAQTAERYRAFWNEVEW